LYRFVVDQQFLLTEQTVGNWWTNNPELNSVDMLFSV
jgi:hypothetical protein